MIWITRSELDTDAGRNYRLYTPNIEPVTDTHQLGVNGTVCDDHLSILPKNIHSCPVGNGFNNVTSLVKSGTEGHDLFHSHTQDTKCSLTVERQPYVARKVQTCEFITTYISYFLYNLAHAGISSWCDGHTLTIL